MEIKTYNTTTELQRSVMGLEEAQEERLYLEEDTQYIKDYKAICNRDDTRKVYSVVSDKYKLLQHKNVFNSVIEELRKFDINFNGRLTEDKEKGRARISAFFKDKVIDDKEKGIMFGVRMTNSFDKSCSFRVELFCVRIACENQMLLKNLIHSIKIKHYGLKEIDIAIETKEWIKESMERFPQFEKLIENAIADSVEWRLTTKLLKSLITSDKHRENILKLIDKNKITRWNIYNAITNYATHGEKISELVFEKLQKQGERILVTRDLNSLVQKEVV